MAVEIIRLFDLERLQRDPRIGPVHVAIYLALCGMRTEMEEPVTVSATKMRRLAKIGGKTPYYRTIQELAEYGYIKYVPSCDPARPSEVWLVTSGEPAGG